MHEKVHQLLFFELQQNIFADQNTVQIDVTAQHMIKFQYKLVGTDSWNLLREFAMLVHCYAFCSPN